MKKTFFIAISSLLIITACKNHQPDLKAEEASILKIDSAWSVLASEGKDVEKIISYWSDDAVVAQPGQPLIKGKEALRKMITDSYKIPGFKISWKSSDVHFSPDGKMAYMYGENAVSFNDSTGKTITIPGRGYTVWNKQGDTAWKCAVDIWNGN
jgi:ketosteroid isomerase-like protein